MIKQIKTGLILLLVSTAAHSQIVYNGHLFDSATREDVVNADVTLSSENITTRSNFFGDFLISYDESMQNRPFQFHGNAILWDNPADAEIMIVGMDGKKHIHHVLNQGDTYLMPGLMAGLYVLRVSFEENLFNYKIASDGSETFMVDKRGFVHNERHGRLTDTLFVEKAGYFSKNVLVKGSGEVLDIGLLREEYDGLDYFNELLSPIAFDVISSKPSRSNLGDVKSVQIIYDTKTDLLYYMNTKKYEQHYGFALIILGFNQGRSIFNQTQYTINPERYLYLGSLNYYTAIDKYVLQFVSVSEMTCDNIGELYQKILTTSFIGDRLYFFPIKEEWELCPEIKTISSEELYRGQTYQGLNLASNYGYLRKVSAVDLPETFLNRRDIVLTDGVPNDLPVVAGIITSDFQTPLSHINVLSNSRNTPNMALREAWESPSLSQLDGTLVYLKVEADSYEIRTASIEEATAFWEENEPQKEVVLEKNVAYKTLIDMTDADISFLDKIGGKAANFAEILNVEGVPTPETAFAIPFYYYEQHMEKYGLNKYLEELFQLTDFQENATYRNDALSIMRDSILASPIDTALVEMVISKISNFQNFRSFRFRSSTNAEDLEGFSGAGLYSSKSGKKDHKTKTIETAIKKVWASLWNWRAFEERAYFKINHSSCAMGILVHRSFPDEDANGVLVTKNLYNSNPGFIINVQYKEYSIVFPEPGTLHDQIMLFTWAIDPEDEFTIEYLTFSNVPELGGERVMTDEELFELGRYAKGIKDRFYYNLPHNCNCTYDDFGVDIEFKVDSDVTDRKIYIKQARLYQ